VVGFACAHDVDFRGYLSELAVAEPEQNGGIGTALVRAVQSALVARGCTVLIADLYPPAARFYRKLGWSEPKAKLLGCRLEGEQSTAPLEQTGGQAKPAGEAPQTRRPPTG
jgi:predicted N-acetyltransferase YhbS